MSSIQPEFHQNPENQIEQTTSFNINSTTNQEENNYSIACLAILKRISDVCIVILICFVGIISVIINYFSFFIFLILAIFTKLAIFCLLSFNFNVVGTLFSVKTTKI